MATEPTPPPPPPPAKPTAAPSPPSDKPKAKASAPPPTDTQLTQIAATIAAGAVALTCSGAVNMTHAAEDIAKKAVAIARALLAELNQPPPEPPPEPPPAT